MAAEESEAPNPAQSTDELRQQLEKILKDTHTNGVSVAIVHKDGPEWVTGLGIADVASGRAAKADTLFRIGSTSKAFTSLSILMLADQGKLFPIVGQHARRGAATSRGIVLIATRPTKGEHFCDKIYSSRFLKRLKLPLDVLLNFNFKFCPAPSGHSSER